MIKPATEVDYAKKLLKVFSDESEKVEKILKQQNDPAYSLFIRIRAYNILKIDGLLKQTDIQSKEEEEILTDVLEMLIEGFSGRSEIDDIKIWLDFVPWTLEGYLKNYGLLRKPEEQEIPVTTWVYCRQRTVLGFAEVA